MLLLEAMLVSLVLVHCPRQSSLVDHWWAMSMYKSLATTRDQMVIFVSVVQVATYVIVSGLYCHVEVHGSAASRDHVDVISLYYH